MDVMSTIDPYALLISELEKNSDKKEPINRTEIRKIFKNECCTKGRYFIRDGEIPSKMGFIVQGLVKYYYIDSDGNEWIKHFSAENDFVASYASFLYQTPSLYFIESLEETTILTINYDVYMKYLQNSFTWNSIARKYTEKIYYEKEKREASFLKEDGSERYTNFFNEYKDLADRLSLKDIASFLGMTAVQLSRIRNKKISKS
jgi:CRP-like cAMP-binding protein